MGWCRRGRGEGDGGESSEFKVQSSNGGGGDIEVCGEQRARWTDEAVRRWSRGARKGLRVKTCALLAVVVGVVGGVDVVQGQTGLPPAPAGVQTSMSYGIEFSHITHPGNSPYNSQFSFNGAAGSVGYEYRIARTEVTCGQWVEFLNAYLPYMTESWGDATGTWVNPPFVNGGVFGVSSASVQRPAEGTWYLAAKFCNWLHNDKGTTRAAFESGAYDVSTFPASSTDPLIRDQPSRSPGARFWLPTQDEWIKATYFDPNRNGPGQPGYWEFPNASNVLPVPGPPTDPSATTNAGYNWVPATEFVTPVGSYSSARSPWGLFDTSGGAKEWTETNWGSTTSRNRAVMGSIAGDGVHQLFDALWFNASTIPNWVPTSTQGFRIAAAVPSPSSGIVFACAALTAIRRRR